MNTRTGTEEIVAIAVPTPFPVGAANTFLVRRDPLILVDAGMGTEAAWEIFQCKLAACGASVRDLGAVLLTHGHVDHVGLLARIVEASGAIVYAHPIVAGNLEGSERPASRELVAALLCEFGVPGPIAEACLDARDNFGAYATYGVPATAVHEGEEVFGFTVCHVPGHSPADTLYVDRERQCAFTGDHLLKTVHPNPIVRPPRAGQQRAKALIEYRHSLERTRALDLRLCYPGHGRPFEEPSAVIDRILARQDQRAEEALRHLADGPITPFTLCQAFYGKMKPEYLYLGLSAAVGFLELLEERALATHHHRNGVLHFTLISG